jgi:hypothetical protein
VAAKDASKSKWRRGRSMRPRYRAVCRCAPSYARNQRFSRSPNLGKRVCPRDCKVNVKFAKRPHATLVPHASMVSVHLS